MSKGVNKAIVIGRLGQDPEIREHNGVTYATISLATETPQKDNATGEWTSKTEWVRVKASNRLAEVMQQYLHKGSQVYIEGRITTKIYQKDGQERYDTYVAAKDMEMLGGRSDNQQTAAPAAPRQGGNNPPPVTPRDMPKDFDDDIPNF